jgi:fumarate reductase iron-sulfur subunit
LNREIMAYGAGIFECTLCGECEPVCPHGISPKESIEMLRDRVEEMKK